MQTCEIDLRIIHKINKLLNSLFFKVISLIHYTCYNIDQKRNIAK